MLPMPRREFLKVAAAGAVLPLSWVPQSESADELYDRSIVFDSLSIERWDKEGFAAAKASGYTGIQTSLSNRNLEAAVRALTEWQNRFREHPDKLLPVVKAADIERAKREGKLGVTLGFQNATCAGRRVENLDTLYHLGARCIQLTYNSRNLLGDGCTERTNAGLSDFGVAVVERMNELGILVDLSHCGQQTASDAIEMSKKPPAFTHTMCKALHNHPRAKSDEQIRAISAKGGMTGLVTLGYFVSPTPEANVDDYLDHIDHAVKVGGLDHVGLASDYQIRGIEASATRENWYVPRLTSFKPSYNVRWPPWIDELDKPDRFRVVTRGLRKRGYRTTDIEKLLGFNWVRYFREVVG